MLCEQLARSGQQRVPACIGYSNRKVNGGVDAFTCKHKVNDRIELFMG